MIKTATIRLSRVRPPNCIVTDHIHIYGRNMFLKNKSFECDICGEKYNIKGNFDRHMVSVHNKELELAQCEICLRRFISPAGLKQHIKRGVCNAVLARSKKNIHKCNTAQCHSTLRIHYIATRTGIIWKKKTNIGATNVMLIL